MTPVVYVVVFAVVATLACFTVIAVLGWRTFQRVKALGRAVAAASERIEEASAALEAAAPANRE